MRIRRRSLRKLLIAVGCVVGIVEPRGIVVGGLLLASGSALHLWSKGCLEQNRNLTTAGPYRWTRNPFYLANLLIDLGLCVVIGRWQVAALFLPIWWFAYRDTMRREEQRLLALFPDAYPDYHAAVALFFPRGQPLPADQAEGRFSWQNPGLAQGAEYARLLGIWLAPGIIRAGEILRHEGFGIFAPSNSPALALIVFLPCIWVLKLALAETYRRPGTSLLPFLAQPLLRHGVTGLLLGSAIFIGRMWAFSLPLLWLGLMLLDNWGQVRLGRVDRVERSAWRYFPWIALASGTLFVLLAGLTYLAGR